MVDLSQLEKVKTDTEVELDNAKNEAIAYLRSTDWYVLRYIETDKLVPDDIASKRAEARNIIEKIS